MSYLLLETAINNVSNPSKPSIQYYCKHRHKKQKRNDTKDGRNIRCREKNRMLVLVSVAILLKH